MAMSWYEFMQLGADAAYRMVRVDPHMGDVLIRIAKAACECGPEFIAKTAQTV